MQRICLFLAPALALVWITAWATVPMPVVTGDSLSWPAVAASTINVHRGDGSYLESLPGTATTWTAPEPGDYYLVAADDREWRDWPRSVTVTIEGNTTTGAPMPVAQGNVLFWPLLSAISINVHRGDGSYLVSLPGTATQWRALEYGEYYLVATNESDWPSWPRSETVTIRFNAGSVSAVTGLRADVYSRTAAEIFWGRKPGIGNRYLVLVDGEEVTNTDGTSWFSDDFTEGSTTVMSVAAVDADGNQSVPASVPVTTPSGNPAVAFPTISRDNYEDLLTDVFGAYFSTQYRDPLLDLTDSLLSSVIGAAFPFDAPYSCVNGGQALFNGPFNVQFDDCRIGSAVHTGEFRLFERNTGFGSAGLTIITDMNREIQFDGNVNGPTSSDGFYQSLNVNVSVNTTEGELRLENANHDYGFGHLQRCCTSSENFTSGYQGSFKLRSPNTGNQFVNAETLTGFFYSHPRPTQDSDYQPAGWSHLEGILSVSATDGSRLILNADTGDDDTVSIQLINGAEMQEFNQSWTSRWSVWQRILSR